ncbi:MAG: bifunctional phosphoribosylaminoimidazolecarboxamide formyltransferase/IMP cyclohydrolase [Acidobacteriota bacterium]
MSPIQKKVLISVYYKDGIEILAEKLSLNGWEIISTGGTARYLKENNIKVTEVSEITGFPEILDGRVKTLHPKIFGSILAKDTPGHTEDLKSFSISKIGLVIVNFYPFEEFLEMGENNPDIMIEKIDIGGPSMVRAAAKNYNNTLVVVDKHDYSSISEKIISGEINYKFRKELAEKAFSYTSYYDSLIANFFSGGQISKSEYLNIPAKKYMALRYGENPHQNGSVYITDKNSPIKKMDKLHGKELSYNNILDLSMVYEVINQFKDSGNFFSVIVKHQNPCGAAISDSQLNSFEKSLSGDPVSAFGGIVGFNKTLEEETAKKIKSIFMEVIIAPDFTEEALNILKKKKNLRLIKIPLGYIENNDIKTIPGGLIYQERDNKKLSNTDFVLKTDRKLSDKERSDLDFGWKLVKFIKSNGILIVKDLKIIGVGAGQMSRVDSVELAIKKSKFSLNGSVLLSDAFFPFKDSIEICNKYKIAVVAEPGGSIRDDEVINEAQESGISLIFTGVRHFRH